jgi:hypothetical protein
MRTLFFGGLFWSTLLLAFIDPFYGIVHYTLINIIRPEQLMWGGSIGRIYIGSQVACFLSWLLNSKKLTPEDTSTPYQFKLLCVVVLGMSISTIFSLTPPGLSWQWTSQFMKSVVFCFVMSKALNTAKKLEWYYAITLVWLMLLQLWGIQQKYLGNVRLEGLGGVMLSDSNDLSSIMVLYFPMAYYSLFSRNKWVKLIGIPTTFVSVIFILYGGSRGASVGLAICLFFIFWRTPGLQKFKMAFNLAVFGILLILIISAVAPKGFLDEYTARIQTIFGEKEEETGEVKHEASAESRKAMWKMVYYFLKQHPEFWLTGLGMRGFPVLYFNYISDIEPYLNTEEYGYVLYTGTGGRAIHNTYLNMLTSGGLLVFLPWLYLLFYSWFQAHTIPTKYPRIVDEVDIHNYARAIEIGLVGAYATIFFINTEFVDFYYWHMMMAGIIANLGMARLKREELGLEDEELLEPSSQKPVYAY